MVFSFVLSGLYGDTGIRLTECTQALERLVERHEFLVRADEEMDEAIWDFHEQSLDPSMREDYV